MKSTSQVVELNKARNNKQAGGRRLSPVLIKVRESAIEFLKVSLRQLFDHSDDAFFELADTAGSNIEQSGYFDAMRELRLQRKKIALDFLKTVSHSFTSLLSDKPDTSETIITDLESIGLMQNDDLEIRLAIDTMGSKVRSRCGISLEHIQMRFELLYQNQTFSKNTLLLGPEQLSQCFVDASKCLEMPIESRLVFFKLFERFVLNSIDQFYSQCNQLMAKQGVLPGLVEGHSAKRVHRPAPPQQPRSNYSNSTQSPRGDYDLGLMSAPIDDAYSFENLSQMLHASSVNVPGGFVSMPVTGGSATQALIPRDALVDAFGAAQHDDYMISANEVRNGLLNFRALLEQAAKQRFTEGARLNQLDEDVINLVAMLFEFILDDHLLLPEMKALIARLQIPILKVAILDRAFFSKSKHPARKLLNEIAAAALGWQPKPEGTRDPLKHKIETVVQNLLDDFDQDVSLFQSVLEDFQIFISQEKRRSQLVEQRTCDAEEGRAKNDKAKEAVGSFLSERITSFEAKGDELPVSVLRLLNEGWQKVLFLTYLKFGGSSSKWQSACDVVDRLLWSIAPDVAQSDSKTPEGARTELLQTIPGLIQALREGLQEAALDTFKIDTFLKSIEPEHVNALQLLSSKVPPVKTESPVASQMAQKSTLQVLDTPKVEDKTSAVEVGNLPEDAIISEQEASISEQEASISEQDASINEQNTSDSEDFSLEQMAQALDAIDLDFEDDLLSSDDIAQNKQKMDESAQIQVEPSLFKEASEPVIRVEQNAGPGVDVQKTDTGIEDALSSLAISEEERARHQLLIDTLAVGTWFEFIDEHQEKVRCKLAAIIKMTGKFIFVNRMGVKLFDRSRDELFLNLAKGSLYVLDDGMLFDRALESIIGNLRENRQNA